LYKEKWDKTSEFGKKMKCILYTLIIINYRPIFKDYSPILPSYIPPSVTLADLTDVNNANSSDK